MVYYKVRIKRNWEEREQDDVPLGKAALVFGGVKRW